MSTNFANRLISARKMAGLSLQSLADRLNNVVTKQSLSKYEQGKMKPDSSIVVALANALGVSSNYFYTEPAVQIHFENIDFRKFTSKLTMPQEEAVVEKAKDLFERYFELENILCIKEAPEYFVYDEIVKTQDDAEAAAIKLRADWNLGYDPIPDVVEMLEDKGYKVIEFEAPAAFDGFKANVGDEKVIVLRKDENGNTVRKRLTALHELAHHALTFASDITPKEQEKLCHSFASALLYPAEMAKKEMQKERFHFYENELRIIKERWGISYTATFSRALHLGIINENVYKKFNIGYKMRNYHKDNNEPGNFRGKETPTRMERLVYIGLANEILSINEAAYFAGISSWTLRSQMNQLV